MEEYIVRLKKQLQEQKEKNIMSLISCDDLETLHLRKGKNVGLDIALTLVQEALQKMEYEEDEY